MLSNDPSEWNFNINSSQQVQQFLYEFLNLNPLTAKNEKGNYSVDESIISEYATKYNIEFCSLLLNYRKLYKAINTYLADIFRNIDYDTLIILHPDFWLNTAETFRSSSSNPNFQNFPKHGDLIPGIVYKIIRKLFICSITEKNKGKTDFLDWLLGEVDYIQNEMKVAGMLSDDPQLIQDMNEDLDFHSHWAIEIFGLKGMSYKEVKEKYDDTYRFLAKNNFTFANIFGAGNISIAEEFRKFDSYKEYVHSKYKQMNAQMNWDSFYVDYSEKHIQECQNAYYSRYPVFKAWQDGVVKKFYETGYVDNPFGFRRRYPLKRNEIINHPIQSSAFLLLLDSIIQIEKIIKKEPERWKSRLIGQIHDSGMNNIYKYEAIDYIDMVNEIMINKPHLPWTRKVKMGTDWSLGHDWYSMKKLKLN